MVCFLNIMLPGSYNMHPFSEEKTFRQLVVLICKWNILSGRKTCSTLKFCYLQSPAYLAYLRCQQLQRVLVDIFFIDETYLSCFRFQEWFLHYYLCNKIKERRDIRGKSPIYWPEEEHDSQILSEPQKFSTMKNYKQRKITRKNELSKC